MRTHTTTPVHPLSVCTNSLPHDHAVTFDQLGHAAQAMRNGAPSTVTGTECGERVRRFAEFQEEWSIGVVLDASASDQQRRDNVEARFRDADATTANALLRWQARDAAAHGRLIGEPTDLDLTAPSVQIFEPVPAPADCIGHTHEHRRDPATIRPRRVYDYDSAAAVMEAAADEELARWAERAFDCDFAQFLRTRAGRPRIVKRVRIAFAGSSSQPGEVNYDPGWYSRSGAGTHTMTYAWGIEFAPRVHRPRPVAIDATLLTDRPLSTPPETPTD
ncbi:hypothetical protein [Curtobacterium sp. Curtsp57]|uniref:hypothetical protein n=1 Tax=Curtobacterium sp. Curtsp57 TaxID=3243047 RepID=UPI0039B68DB6